MSTPAEVVADSYALAQEYVDANETKLVEFLDIMQGALTPEATFDVTFDPVSAPSLIGAPTRPASLEEVEPEFDYDADGSIEASKPDELVLSAPNFEVSEFEEVAPTLDEIAPPTVTIGDAPTVPEVEDIEIPEAPVVTLPDTPTYLTLTTPTFAGVDLHESFRTGLETKPELTLVAPTPFSYSPNPDYSSTLLTALKAALETRMAGGTGVSTAVENAYWGRAMDREVAAAQGNINEVARNSEGRGFALPDGVFAEQTRRAQKGYYDKVSELSREVAVKKAEQEQLNAQHTIEQSVALEGKLIDYSSQMEQLAFTTAKTVAENAIAIYNAQVDLFKAEVASYESWQRAYKTIIDGELAEVEVYKAEIAGENAKAETNRTLVMQYEAEVRARLGAVEIYKAQIDGAKARIDLESAKIAVVGEQIKAYIAGINGETAKVEAYKAQVGGQQAVVDIYKTKALAFAAVSGAEAENARAQISYYQAQVTANGSAWDAWKSRVTAESERIRAVAMKSNAALDGYRADISKYEAQIRQNTEYYGAQIKQYEAQRTYTITAERLNTEIVKSNREITLEVGKVGSQTFGHLMSSAYGMIHSSASVSGTASNNVSYSYSNDTETAPPAITAV